MADSGSSSSVSGGMDMGRERLQSKNDYSYLGQDSQTSPLEDLGDKYMDLFSQSQAQKNLLFGGPGYGGSFVPKAQRPAGGPTGGGATTVPPGLGGGVEAPGPQKPPPPTPGPGYGMATPTSTLGVPDDAIGAMFNPQPGESDVLSAGGEATGLGDGAMLAAAAGGQEYQDPYTTPDGGYTGPGPGSGPGTPDPTINPKPANYGATAPYAAGMDPRFGKWNPVTGKYDMSVGMQDPGKFPVHDPNYNPLDPTWKYYTQQAGNTYNPLNPSLRNDADWARTSPVTPQGSNINDAWSTSVPWRPEAPTGGLYGAYNDLGQKGPISPEEAIQTGIAGLMASGQIGGMSDAEVRNYLGDVSKFASNPMDANDDLALKSIEQLYGFGSEGEQQQLQGYKNMLARPGYSDTAKNAIAQNGMLAARAAADANSAQMMNLAKRTNNPAAVMAGLAGASRGESQALGAQARQNAIDFENVAKSDTEKGLAGLGQNAGISNQRQLGAGGLATNMLNDVRGQKLAALSQRGQGLDQAYGRQATGLSALGATNQQLLNRRLAGIGGQQKLYDAETQSNADLLKQLQSLYSTRREDNTQLGKTTGNGGLWA